MESNQETNTEQEFNETEPQGKAKQWLQDNLRIIISVIIVVLIAGGIYSYSKRTETSQSQQAVQTNDQSADELAGSTPDSDTGSASETAPAANSETAQQPSQEKAAQGNKQPSNVSSTATSQETENSFVLTAARGDSSTRLARAALANYLEKNSDSSLTAEHKIYVEDYIRKHTPSKRVMVGTSVEFQKNLIQDAINHAKNLNQRQLQNLHKYVVRVPSLS